MWAVMWMIAICVCVCVSVNPILNGRTHLVFSHHLLCRAVGRFVNPGGGEGSIKMMDIIFPPCPDEWNRVDLPNKFGNEVGGGLSYPPAPTFRRPVLSKAWRLEKADTNKKCIQEKGQGRARAHRSNNGVKKSYEVASDIRTPLRMKNCYILAKERPQL